MIEPLQKKILGNVLELARLLARRHYERFGWMAD